MKSSEDVNLPESEVPHVRALPADAPVADYESLAHIPFPPGFRARRGVNWMLPAFVHVPSYAAA